MNPEEQGLKHCLTSIGTVDRSVSEMNPEEQGLKHGLARGG